MVSENHVVLIGERRASGRGSAETERAIDMIRTPPPNAIRPDRRAAGVLRAPTPIHPHRPAWPTTAKQTLKLASEIATWWGHRARTEAAGEDADQREDADLRRPVGQADRNADVNACGSRRRSAVEGRPADCRREESRPGRRSNAGGEAEPGAPSAGNPKLAKTSAMSRRVGEVAITSRRPAAGLDVRICRYEPHSGERRDIGHRPGNAAR